jgi:sulfoxide reductase heme-binding subunit YedZ
MIAFTSPFFWYTSRATGFVALILFTLVVSLGTFVANRIGGTIVGRFELNELHRSVSIVAVIFLAIHIVSTVVDSYVPTGWISVLVPMTSAYKRLPVAIGTVAFDLILAVWISSLLKVRISNSSWRFIHWFSWLAFVSAIVHTLLIGTDSRSGVGLILVIVCAGVVLLAAIWRYFGRPTRAAGRTALSPLDRNEKSQRSSRPPADAGLSRAAPGSRAARHDLPTEAPFPRVPRDATKRKRR